MRDVVDKKARVSAKGSKVGGGGVVKLQAV